MLLKRCIRLLQDISLWQEKTETPTYRSKINPIDVDVAVAADVADSLFGWDPVVTTFSLLVTCT